jgi:hypothetical protein
MSCAPSGSNRNEYIIALVVGPKVAVILVLTVILTVEMKLVIVGTIVV